jgi:hypothetical protein
VSIVGIPFVTEALSVSAWVGTDEGVVLGPVSPYGIVLRDPTSLKYDMTLEVRFDICPRTADLAGHKSVTFDAVTVTLLGHVARKKVPRVRLQAGDVFTVMYTLDAAFAAEDEA